MDMVWLLNQMKEMRETDRRKLNGRLYAEKGERKSDKIEILGKLNNNFDSLAKKFEDSKAEVTEVIEIIENKMST